MTVKCVVYNKSCDSLREVGDSTIQFATTVLPDVLTGETSVKGMEISRELLYNRSFLLDSLLPFFRPMLKGIFRVLKTDGVFILNVSSCVRYPESVSFCALLPLVYAEYVVQVSDLRLMRDFLIVQTQGKDGYTGDDKEFELGFVATHQHLLMFTKSAKWKMNAEIVPSVWYYEMPPHQKDLPTMFSPVLMDRMIELFSNPNDWVLDPLGGSGTTAYSGIRMNRNCILYEINPEYIPYIRNNVEIEGVEFTLFPERTSPP